MTPMASPAEKDEKHPDPRKAMVVYWKAKFKEETGSDCAFTWGACMNMLYRKFEVADQKTGEMFEDYPTFEMFKEQVDGFFRDPWVTQNKAWKFNAFLGGGYGGWAKVTVREKPRVSRYTPPPPVQDTGKVHQLLEAAGFGKKVEPAPFKCEKCDKVHSPKFICENSP